MDDPVSVSGRIDKLLREVELESSDKTSIRAQLAAAAEAEVSTHAAAIAALDAAVTTNTAGVATNAAGVATNAGGVSTNAAAIAALDATVATHTADLSGIGATITDHATAIDGLETAVAANTETIGNINDTLSSAVTGVASVAGLTGVISGPDLRGALSVELNADVTDAANVGAAIASAAVKAVLVDDDTVGGLDSEAAGALKRFSIASIVARATAVFDALYASIAQGAKADSALQPATAVELTRLQLTPAEFASLPTAATAGAGAVANINDGSVGVTGSAAAAGGAITQRVISNGTDWIVDSGVGGGLQALQDDASPQLGGILDAGDHQVRLGRGSDLVSTSELNVGDDGNFYDVTGTTTINSLLSKGVGTTIKLRFVSATTLTHNATSLILPTGANIVTEAGDVAEFVEYTTGNWRCTGYLRFAGTPLAGGGGLANVGEDPNPQLGGILDANGKQVRLAKGNNVASAAVLTIGDDGNFFTVTGSAAVTSIAAKAIGTRIQLHFDGTLTLTHHASNLILPSAAHIVTAAGDVAEFVQHNATGWRCTGYLRASSELGDYVRFADLTDGTKVDGDRFDIDYPAQHYTPRVVGVPEALNTDSLAAHLAGIDEAIGSGAIPDANGDLLAVSLEPAHYVRTVGEGHPLVTQLSSHLAGIDLGLAGRLRPEDVGDGAKLDGDVIDVDFAPQSYEPTVTGAPEAVNAQSLAAHLKGIDNVISGIAVVASRQWLTYEVLGPHDNWANTTTGASGFVTCMPATLQVHSIVLSARENTGHEPTFKLARGLLFDTPIFSGSMGIGGRFAKGTRESGLGADGAPRWSSAGYVITQGTYLYIEVGLVDPYALWSDWELLGMQIAIEVSAAP